MKYWIIGIVLLYVSISYAQERSLVFREDGKDDRVVTQVVTSEQQIKVIAELKAIKAILEEQQTQLDILIANTLGSTELEPVNIYINTATMDELLQIPGIGSVKAGTIISERGTPDIIGYKPFESWQDLMNRVTGIGPSTLADIQAAGVELDKE